MMPRIMPVRAWLSPPSRPWDARISLSALWPNAQANGETTKVTPQKKNAPISSDQAQHQRQRGLGVVGRRRHEAAVGRHRDIRSRLAGCRWVARRLPAVRRRAGAGGRRGLAVGVLGGRARTLGPARNRAPAAEAESGVGTGRVEHRPALWVRAWWGRADHPGRAPAPRPARWPVVPSTPRAGSARSRRSSGFGTSSSGAAGRPGPAGRPASAGRPRGRSSCAHHPQPVVDLTQPAGFVLLGCPRGADRRNAPGLPAARR